MIGCLTPVCQPVFRNVLADPVLILLKEMLEGEQLTKPINILFKKCWKDKNVKKNPNKQDLAFCHKHCVYECLQTKFTQQNLHPI